MAQVHTSSGLRALREATIASVATYGCGEAPGSDDMVLLARAACSGAVQDAGLTMQDIDGFGYLQRQRATMWPMPVIGEHLGINPSYVNGTMLGGSSFIAHLLPSIMALKRASAAMCWCATAAPSARPPLAARNLARRASSWTRSRSNTRSRSTMPVAAYAMAAARHMHQYGTTREAARRRGRLGAPMGAKTRPSCAILSIADVLGAHGGRPVHRARLLPGDRRRRRLVLSRAEDAHNGPNAPDTCWATPPRAGNRQISSMPDLTVTAASQSRRAGVRDGELVPADMDVAELYDAFTINTLLFLEDLGLSRRARPAPLSPAAPSPARRQPARSTPTAAACRARAPGHVRHLRADRSRAPAARPLRRAPGGRCPVGAGPWQRRHAVEPGHPSWAPPPPLMQKET